MWVGILIFIFAFLIGILAYHFTQDIILTFAPIATGAAIALFYAIIRWRFFTAILEEDASENGGMS